MISPSLDAVRALAADYNLVPLYRNDLADTETPVAAYWRLNQDRPGFLLESVEGGEHLGRFSFIGGQPRASVTLNAGTATVEPCRHLLDARHRLVIGLFDLDPRLDADVGDDGAPV